MKVPSLKNVHFFLNIFFLFSGKPRDKKNRQKQYVVVPGFTDNWKAGLEFMDPLFLDWKECQCLQVVNAAAAKVWSYVKGFEFY